MIISSNKDSRGMLPQDTDEAGLHLKFILLQSTTK